MIGEAREVIQWLMDQDKGKVYEIKEHRKRRSLNANNFCWLIIGRIADAMRTSKDDVYLLMLKRYGQSNMVSVVSSIDVSRFFKYYEEAGRTRLQGKDFTHYRVFVGSSEYDSREMAVLIDGIVDEAKALGIETLPPDEIAHLKAMWKP